MIDRYNDPTSLSLRGEAGLTVGEGDGNMAACIATRPRPPTPDLRGARTARSRLVI